MSKRRNASDSPADPGLEKKQRPIAMTALKRYYKDTIKQDAKEIDAILDQLERNLPPDMKIIRDEPLPDQPKSNDKPVTIHSSYGHMLPLCCIQKDTFKAHAFIVIDYIDKLQSIRVADVTCEGRYSSTPGSLFNIRVAEIPICLTPLLERFFQRMCDRNRPPSCAKST